MGQSLAALLGNNLLVRTGAVTLLMVGAFAAATGALPVRCMIGGKCEAANLPAPPTPTAEAPQTQTALAPKADLADVAVVKPVIRKSTSPSLTHNDVLAGTFAQLKVEMKAPVATVAARSPKGSGAPTNSGLATRTVRAVTINPDGTPNFGSMMAEAYANSGRPVTIARPSPALDAAVQFGAGQLPAVDAPAAKAKAVARTAEADPAANATPALAKGTATVLGKGANVRANPSRGSKVLFALSGGETVKIVENTRGWLHVTDDQGRGGWIYSDFVRRGG